jgi:hypothetical protein
MDLGGSRFNFRFWERFAGMIVVLCLVGLFFAMLLHVTYGNVLFIEGILVFGAGVYAASGQSNLKREHLSTMMTDPEGLKEFLEKQRAAQLADGMLIMIVGAIIMAIPIMISLI